MISISPGGYPDAFTVRIIEPGTGRRGYKKDVRSLAEAMACVRHYFGQHGRAQSQNKTVRGCPFCKKKVSKRKDG